LSSDLRGRVRRLQCADPLTAEWNDLTETLQHLSTVALMEEKDSTSKSGSVWDRDELCIRYIVEEGKVNMLTRALIAFKSFQYSTTSPISEENAMRMQVFETSLGTLLKRCFTAIETLQTLDLTMLIEHIGRVLSHAVSPSYSVQTLSPIQEFVVLSYLSSIAQALASETLNEETVCNALRENNVVSLVLQHSEKFRTLLDSSAIASTCFFLSGLFETEAFKAKRLEFLKTPLDKKRLVTLEEPAKQMMSLDADIRKQLRPLIDYIIRVK